MLWLAVAMQATSGPVVPADDPPRTDDRLHAVHPCPTASEPDGEVIVCGRIDPDQYRVRPIPDRWTRGGPVLPTAAVNVPGLGTVSAEAEQGSVGGIPTNRGMLRLKIPF